MYLAHILKPIGIRVTRLAHGIAVGTELSYANRTSVACCFESQRTVTHCLFILFRVCLKIFQ